MPTGSRRAKSGKHLTYAGAGVTLAEKDQFTESLDSIMRRTFGPRVIPNPGGFAGLFRLDYNQRLFRRNYRDPVLVACADGCGTKVKLAAQLRRFETIGIDLVAMNVNDMVVQGAEPLFFLDYIAVDKVDRAMLTSILQGIAEGCKIAGCALLGGETAEMPGVYAPGEFDLAGFAVGVVELRRAVNPRRVRPGDVVLGLESSGVHSNGYTLVRRVIEHARLDLDRVYPELAGAQIGGLQTLGLQLLTPTRIYVPSIVKLIREYRVKKVITGMAHITGSGLAENLVRALNPGVDAIIDRSGWTVPPIFRFLQEHGGIEDQEMRRVFNLGIGFTVIVRPAFADSIAEKLTKLGERVHVIGSVVKGKGRVRDK